MFNLSELFEFFSPQRASERRQTEKLVLQVEARVRQLNGLSPRGYDGNNPNEVLKSTCLLLDRLLESSEPLTDEIEPTKAEVAPEAPAESPPEPGTETEPEPSVTAKELIKLRDGVLVAKSKKGSTSSEVLEAKGKEGSAFPKVLEDIYKQLGQILEKEGVTSLEETGPYNDKRQEVISTKVTDDPDKNDWICDTVRPGYLFQEELLRPQEVIVYTYDSSASTSEVS